MSTTLGAGEAVKDSYIISPWPASLLCTVIPSKA